jgi:translation elongation factor EF-Tu-like GTPase
MMESKREVGRVVHFFPKISVAIIELKAPLAVGDKITIAGATTRLEQVVQSMEVEHKAVKSARTGQSVGLKVVGKVRESDVVYK